MSLSRTLSLQKHHGESGLIQRVKASEVSAAEAEEATLKFLANWVNENASPMCGNSICQDRRFLARYMPKLEKFFHYRNLDVSSVKEIASRWRPEILPGISKNGKHIAMDDVKDSVAELSYYREVFFNLGNSE